MYIFRASRKLPDGTKFTHVTIENVVFLSGLVQDQSQK